MHVANNNQKVKSPLDIFVGAKAMGAIEKCRTGELGAHEDVCDNCGKKKI